MLPLDPDERLLAQVRSVTRPGGGRKASGADEATGTDEADPMTGRLARVLADLADRPEPPAEPPPPELWDRIADAVSDDAPDVVVPEPAAPIPLDVRRGGSARRSAWRMPLAAAAAAAVVAVVASVGVLAGSRSGPEVEAEVALAPLEGDATGAARLVRGSDGRRRLALSEQVAAVPPGSYLELWLIDPDSGLQRMVSLGVAEDGASFSIPEGIDPATYRVVDVSIEPADGNPVHSGRSVLRGTLEI